MVVDIRKNVKWATSMMLPEHVALLRNYNAQLKLVDKPFLDEYTLMEIQEDLERALSTKAYVTVRTWKKGILEEYNGVINNVDIPSKVIWIDTSSVNQKIAVEEIVYVRLND